MQQRADTALGTHGPFRVSCQHLAWACGGLMYIWRQRRIYAHVNADHRSSAQLKDEHVVLNSLNVFLTREIPSPYAVSAIGTTALLVKSSLNKPLPKGTLSLNCGFLVPSRFVSAASAERVGTVCRTLSQRFRNLFSTLTG